VIYIFIEKKDYSASRLELHEKSADNTIITFQNKELNKPLVATLFAVK
jgi:phosphoserine aminotransferase